MKLTNHFELIKNPENPLEEIESRTTFEKLIAEKREQLSGLQIEPEPRLKAWKQLQQEEYLKEYLELGGDADIDVPVYFIPEEHRPVVQKICEQSFNANIRAFHDPATRSVVIFMDNKNFESLASARYLTHEFAHAYSREFIRLRLIKDEDAGISRRFGDTGGMGLHLQTHTADLGTVFEEYYAVEKEHEANTQLSFIFPEEVRKEAEVRKKLVNERQIKPEQAPYVIVTDIGEKIQATLAYQVMHSLVAKIMERIPDGMQILKKARVSGKWRDFSNAVNKAFGPGAFKTIVHVGSTDKEGLALLQSYIDASPEKRLSLEQSIISRHKELMLISRVKKEGKSMHGSL